MVFARTKLILEDRCFEEEPGTIEVKMRVPRITKVYRKIYEMLRGAWNVPESEIQESFFNWSKEKGQDKFHVRWWVHKDIDVFTYIYVRVDLHGSGTDEEGTVLVRIKGWLRSEYPQDTVWQRSLFYEMLRTFWHRVFYRQKREEFAEECRHTMIYFDSQVKEFLHRLQQGQEG